MTREQLIFIPGLLNDGELWRDQVSALSGSVDCIVADITVGETIEDLAKSVVALATAPEFSLAGFSLGGFVAQQIMRIVPERVKRLALLDTSIEPDSAERAAGRAAVSKMAMVAGRFHGFGDRMIASYLAPQNLHDPDIVRRVRDMTTRLGPAVLVRQNGIERKDGRDVLQNLSCPLLLLCGEHDRITPLSAHHEMGALTTAPTKLVAVPAAGHMTPIENPDVVIRALQDWMSITLR